MQNKIKLILIQLELIMRFIYKLPLEYGKLSYMNLIFFVAEQ